MAQQQSLLSEYVYKFSRNRVAVVALVVAVLLAVLSLAAPAVAPHNPVEVNLEQQLQPGFWAGNWTYPLGTDNLGRDILSRLLYGGAISLRVGYMVIGLAGANVFMAVFNAEAEPVNDPLVRQAIRHGVDLEALVESVYGGLGTVAATPMPPTVFGFADDLAPYEYDPQRARELLAEAGYPDGIAITINSFIAARPYVPKPLDAAQIMESQLSEAGIDVTIESNEWGTHSDIMDNDNHQIGLTGWYDVPYPSNFLKTMLLEGADTNWDHQQMQELALQALGTYERAEQERIYRQMQQITHQEVPVIPIAHSDYTAASRAEVEGLELDVVGTIKAHNVRY
jgi:peptide/nickel transport system substrate-binding protein